MNTRHSIWFHLAVLLGLIALHYILPPYHHGQLARIMVLAVYAMGYNILFGYTGLLSLGHAMFFAAGMYGTGLASKFLDFGAPEAFGVGIAVSLVFPALIGLLVLRTSGVAFMIVTLMFSQAAYLTILLFGEHTRGDEGFVVESAKRFVFGYDLSTADVRYFAAFGLFAVGMIYCHMLARSRRGRVMVGVRENEERTRLLGYDVWATKYRALVLSGLYSGAAGAAYGLLFGYVGASFATVTYSIFPLLWVLVGGAGVVLGPLIGTAFMVYLVDFASGLTDAYMLFVGVALVLIVLFARAGLMGLVRKQVMPWLP